MRFSIATNFQTGLIPLIKKPGIYDVFGKLATDVVGGGRPPNILPHVSREDVRKHIKDLHRSGLKFNYLLNAICLGNKEFSSNGRREIFGLLDWLEDIKVDSVSVTIPYLCELVKRYYPRFKVCVSVFANVNSVEKARYWEDLGVHKITLTSRELNRDFMMLREIRKNVKCQLQLLANNACLLDCPLAFYHQQLNSHASKPGYKDTGKVDYCILHCDYLRFLRPEKFLASDWIRPEDVHYYEEIGIDSLKLSDRSMPTDKLARIAAAYTARRYDGNLLDILHMHFKRQVAILSRTSKAGKSSVEPAYVDNRALDGFLERFWRKDRRLDVKGNSEYYKKLAKKAVKIVPACRRDIIVSYKKAHSALLEQRGGAKKRRAEGAI